MLTVFSTSSASFFLQLVRLTQRKINMKRNISKSLTGGRCMDLDKEPYYWIFILRWTHKLFRDHLLRVTSGAILESD